MFLVEIGYKKEVEETADGVEIVGFLMCGNPRIAHGLEEEANAVHLAVSTDSLSEGPAKAILTDEIWEKFNIFFCVGAEAGEFAISEIAIGMEL